MQKGFFFFISSTLVIFCLFDNSDSNGCKVISYCGFQFHFPMVSDVQHLCTYLLALVYLIWKNIYSIPLPIFKLNCLSFCYLIVWVLYIFWLNPLLDILFANIFFLFSFDAVLHVYFAFVAFVFGMKYKKITVKTNVKVLFLFSYRCFMVSGLTPKSILIPKFSVVFWLWCKIRICFHSFVCGCADFSSWYFEETILSSIV